MKQRILNYKTKRMIKQRSENASLGYHKSKSAGVIINNDHHWEGLDEFLKELAQDHDEFHALFFEKTKSDIDHKKTVYSPSDFGFFGQVNSEKISQFIATSFDFLFVVDKHPTLFIDFIAVKTNSKTNIGFYYEGGNAVADLQIKPDHGRELADLLRYARQLS